MKRYPAALLLLILLSPVQAAEKEHWAFLPPASFSPPPVRDTTWPNTPIDRFLLARLEAQGLRPVADADRRTLLRRVTLDLTGLPPTPEEMSAFLADGSPGAYERVVERLLASPAYGERWGRHWLDVVRYADSNGLDENVAHGNAWRYRDYVIASFNSGKPFDRFLIEQIAGDLLPWAHEAQRQEHLIATGFLALGPKVLAEVDEKKMEMDIVDEQIDTAGRAFLGLTLGCARCHDHKFDPLSMEDYYALAGIFQSTRTMEHFKKVARWHENPLATPEQVQRVKDHETQLAALKSKIKAAGATPEAPRLREELSRLEKLVLELPTAMGVTEGTVADSPLLRRGNPLNPGRIIPRRFPDILTGATPTPLPPGRSGRLELAQWLTNPTHPLTARVLVNRLWRWHFGRGLVRSVDNFGLLGEKPTHPELLDWLARRVIEDGWSLKQLHRLIVLSHAYQLSAQADSEQARLDPDNRWYGRAPVLRMEAEVLRDSLLAVSGTLDRTMGGSLLHVKNREYLFDHTSKDRTAYDSRRRAVYLPVIRNNLYDVFNLFDAPDGAVSSGDRTSTTVPTQALFAMNSDLIQDAALALAARTWHQGEAIEVRLKRLYTLAYGRPPSAQESKRAAKALGEVAESLTAEGPEGQDRRAWAWLCHALLAANEFVTLP